MTDTLTATRRHLAELPALLARLTVQPGSRPGDPDMPKPPGRPLNERPLADVAVIDLIATGKPDWARWRPGDSHARHGIPGTLWLWAHRARIELALGRLPQPATPTALCQWLAAHAEPITARWPAPPTDFAGAIGRMHHDLERACGIRPDPAYHCPVCGWTIEARDDQAWWSCTGCRRTWTSAAEIDRLLAEQADSRTLPQIAAEVGRPPDTLRGWKMRGLIAPVGRRNGMAVYSLIAVRRVAESIRAGRPITLC